MKNFLQSNQWPILFVVALCLILRNEQARPQYTDLDLDLDLTTIQKKLLPASEPDILIFTADWCVHCRRTVPEWKAQFEKRGKVVRVVNIDKEPDVASKYGVQTVPQIVKLTRTQLPSGQTVTEAEVVPLSVLKFTYLFIRTIVHLII